MYGLEHIEKKQAKLFVEINSNQLELLFSHIEQ